MKKTLTKFIVLIAAMAMALSTSIVAFAADSELQNYITENGFPAGTSSMFKEDSTGMTNPTSYTYGDKTYYISAENEAIAVRKVQTKAKNDAAITTLSDVTTGMNIGADVQTASGMLSGFYPIMSVVIGLIVILISIGMTIFSAFDLCYIAFPVFRNHCEDAKQSGSGLMAKTNKSTGETKLRFVSDDAQYAVNAADTTQSGRNPFVIYFGKRIISYVVLAVLLFILMTGRITIFTDLALKVMSGITNLIDSMT